MVSKDEHLFSMGNMPRVSVLVLNWNGKRFLSRCLDAVFRQDYPDVEVLFIDNGSDDGSVEFVRSAYPQARIIAIARNLGFAPANNIGIAQASGAYVMTLNNDTELDPRCLTELVAVLEQHPHAGSCAPKIISFDAPPVIINVGIESREFQSTDRGHGEPDAGQYDRVEEVFGPNGGAGLYRKAMLDEVGGFDEDFVAYYEDVDLAWRARLAGWSCLYVPGAVCRHAFGGTNKARPFYIEYHIFRNIIWLYVKDLPFRYLREKLPTLMRQELIFWMAHLRRWDVKWLTMKLDTYRKLPTMIRKRQRIQGRRRIDDREFERWYRTSATRPPAETPCEPAGCGAQPSPSSSSTGTGATMS